ncbi:hypothetical protein DH86_00002710 [Scytalidium sp. 3C]|nr:hypothetical protein DH86_00002710 [Scytalidium sp. 3C]
MEKGEPFPLDQYKGKVVLVVNVASKCGFTPQYKGLEELYKSVRAQHPDFEIIGFPCNQFGSQEPGSNDDIQNFCQLNYGVTFPVLGKTEVNGDNANPVYKWLKNEKSGLLGMKLIKWNFEKFLIGRDGKVKGRWASIATPKSLEPQILAELKKGSPAGGATTKAEEAVPVEAPAAAPAPEETSAPAAAPATEETAAPSSEAKI